MGEEVGLNGAKLVDKSKLRSKRGYVLDSGGPIGTIVTNAPSQDGLEVWVHGKTAHAGAEPEKGINAIVVAERGHRGDAAGPHRSRDHRQHRHHPGRRRHQHRAGRWSTSRARRAAAMT